MFAKIFIRLNSITVFTLRISARFFLNILGVSSNWPFVAVHLHWTIHKYFEHNLASSSTCHRQKNVKFIIMSQKRTLFSMFFAKTCFHELPLKSWHETDIRSLSIILTHSRKISIGKKINVGKHLSRIFNGYFRRILCTVVCKQYFIKYDNNWNQLNRRSLE